MRSGSKRISTSFAVILILAAILLGGFLFKYFTKAKPKTLTGNTVAIHPHKKHKKKHGPKKYIAAESSKRSFNTEKITSAPVAAKPVAAKPAEIKSKPVKKIADNIKTSKPNQAFLYATYVQPNITGLVKLRAEGKFYSNTVATIPANSKVWVLEKGDTYYRVSYNNTIGFVPKWALQEK